MDISGKDETLIETKHSRRKFLALCRESDGFLSGACRFYNIMGSKASGIECACR
jgi:hypothetical protein